ncbi:MAG: type II toxin-antitoxin system HicB family antitoxin [Oscillospiraceae bacterium]|jgi:predicted RNase H-like HicB family nuclease|nr:type II toxin-antitoxin system HicB family antitoxin [Oscillospiraceae bacterium]
MKDVYIYPAILSYAKDGISIEFPDFPGCLPCADTTEEAVKNAREALSLHIWGMERDGDTIPAPAKITELNCGKNEISLLVEIFMPSVRERLNNRYIKKTLTIPQWLNIEAERAGVNFSQVLQNGLKEYLHINK